MTRKESKRLPAAPDSVREMTLEERIEGWEAEFDGLVSMCKSFPTVIAPATHAQALATRIGAARLEQLVQAVRQAGARSAVGGVAAGVGGLLGGLLTGAGRSKRCTNPNCGVNVAHAAAECPVCRGPVSNMRDALDILRTAATCYAAESESDSATTAPFERDLRDAAVAYAATLAPATPRLTPIRAQHGALRDKIIVETMTRWVLEHKDPGSLGEHKIPRDDGKGLDYHESQWKRWETALRIIVSNAYCAGEIAEEIIAGKRAAVGEG